MIAAWQKRIWHSGNRPEQARRQTRTDRRVRDAELPDRIHTRAGQDVLEGRCFLSRLILLQDGLIQIGVRQRQRRSANAAFAVFLIKTVDRARR